MLGLNQATKSGLKTTRMTEEGKLQKKITDYLKNEKWFVTKLMQTSTNGIPDVLAVRRDEAIFIEVKTQVGRLSKLQEYRIKELVEQFDQWVCVAYRFEDFIDFYNKYKKTKDK